MRIWLLVAAILLWSNAAQAEPLSGTVLNGKTLRPIAGAKLIAVGSDISVTTNDAGRFFFDDLPKGTVQIRLEAEGYEPGVEEVDLSGGGLEGQFFVLLPPGVYSEVIEVEETAPPVPTPPGQTDLRREELTRIPGTRGDALTSLKSLPGVANADAAGAGPGLLVIRGAAPEDSKVTIDGIQVPLLYHFFGLQSILPSEFIDSIDYLPGGFGVEEGRATGGVIGISTRSEELEKTSGFAELSFINFAAFAQGPISKEHHLQYAVGVRRSLIDFILPQVIPDSANIAFVTAPQYYDAQARIDWRPNYANRLSFLGLASFDLLTLLNDNVLPNVEEHWTGKFDNETSFSRLIATWAYAKDKIENRLVAAGGVTGFRIEIGDERYLRGSQPTLEVRDDFLLNASSRLQLRVGAQLYLTDNRLESKFPLPPQEGSGGIPDPDMLPLLELDDNFPMNGAATYLAASVQPIKGTSITPGVRLDYFERIDHVSVLPRLSAQHQIDKKWTVRAALGSYSRAPDGPESLQTDLEPEVATQYVLGVDYNIAEGIKLSTSGFFTDRRRLIVQDPYAMDAENAYLNRGYGRSFGAEALLRVKRDRFFGWIAYTVSRSDRIDGPSTERRLFDFDQTHNFIVVGSYTLGPWEFGGRWQYNTGNPVTPIVGSLYLSDLNKYIPILGEINSGRLDAAHQMDLRIDRKWKFSDWTLSAYLDVTNVYAHPKVLGLRYNFDYSEAEAIEELPLVPALGVRGSF